MMQYSGDLTSCATLALVQAMDDFDPSLGSTFQVYSRCKMVQAVIDEVRSILPDNRYGNRQSELGKDWIGTSLSQWRITTDQDGTERNESHDIVAEDDESIDNAIFMGELWSIISKLSQRERRIITMMYRDGVKQKEVSCRLGVTPHVVTRSHTNTINKLKQIFAINNTKPLYKRKKRDAKETNRGNGTQDLDQGSEGCGQG